MDFNTDQTDCQKYSKILQVFAESLKIYTSETYSNEFLLRYLKVNDYNIEKAKEMFRYNLRTRELFRLNFITKEYKMKKVTEECDLVTFLGFDKDNFPIAYMTYANADLKGILYSYSMFEVFLHCAYWVESLKDHQKEFDKKFQKHREFCVTAIIDFEGFPWQRLMNKMVLDWGYDSLKLFQECYPSIVNHAFIINVPSYFATMYNMFKPLIKADLAEKITICDKNLSASALLEVINPKVLPKFLGGSRVDENGDPFCASFMNFGKLIPEEEYLKNQPKLQVSQPGVSEMIVRIRSHKNLSIKVNKPCSKLKIEFCSDGTIGFQILYQSNLNEDIDSQNSECKKSTSETICPYFKVFAHISPAHDIVFCSRAGIYLLHFDNSFSWIASKTIVHRITVIEPPV